MDVDNFFCKLRTIYEDLQTNKTGSPATYIPQLGRVEPDLFGVSVYTIDNQIFNLGDTDHHFCIQSCSKPGTYALALMEHGLEKVSKHINIEASGKRFNALEFDENNLPYNPMVNPGAIMATSLIKQGHTPDARFAHISNFWKEMLGQTKVGFDMETYLGELRTADDNYSASFKMRANGVFPPNTDIDQTIRLYTQACSLTVNSRSMALFAAILANGGVSPKTGKVHMSSDIVKHLLCIMSTSGLYDYSGRWFTRVGLPAKSGVAGCIFVVIPNFGGICVFSPRLDKYGNSVRGVELFNKLINVYKLHIHDHFTVGNSKCRNIDSNMDRLKQLEIFEACRINNFVRLKQLLKDTRDVNFCDYDSRYPLHIAVTNRSLECIWILMLHGANYQVNDYSKMRPLRYAIDYQLRDVLVVLLFGQMVYRKRRDNYPNTFLQ